MSLFTVLIFLLVLSLLVFVHEFGHFITAKRAGIRIEEFGFGFPPRIFGIKRGETLYSVNWIPLGGFVKIKGEDGSSAADKDSFASKSIGRRIIIITAGVVMNVIFAAVLLSIGAFIGMPGVVPEGDKFARIRDVETQIISVLPGSPAEREGVAAWDIVLSADGKVYGDVEDLRAHISKSEKVALKIKRDGQELEKTIETEVLPQAEGRIGVGIGLIQTGIISYPWYIAPVKGVEGAGFYIKEIVLAFGRIFGDLFVGRRVSVDLSGPVGIAVLTARFARLGFVYLLQFMAMLSMNLAFINILPFPALDGGRALFLGIEKARGKPVPPKVEAMIHNLGFVILIMLVLLVSLRDIMHYSSGFFSKFGG